jgi:filamentous hemagglutinin family protein
MRSPQNIMSCLKLALMAATALCAVPNLSFAQSAPVVTNGAATIIQTPGQTTVNQSSERAAISWQQFGVRAGEQVRINQPGASSISLQRVTGNSVSVIDGALSSNGQIILSNPNGTLITSNGVINVNGMVATTGQVNVNRMMSHGDVQIERATTGKLVVNGTINAARGGVTLVGQDISTGPTSLISTIGGSVNIAGADQAVVSFDGDKLIGFAVPKQIADSAQRSGSLPASVARDAISGVVNLGGAIVSNMITTTPDGTVIIGQAVPAGVRITGGTVVSGGSVTAPGQRVEIGGTSISVSGTIDTSGNAISNGQAGAIYVGGGWQGAPLETGLNSTVTNVAPLATLRADGDQTGGTIVVWSDVSTTVAGTISANGKAEGGKIETSGKVNLAVLDSAKVTATGAKPGSWLLDPLNITVGAGPATLLEVADTGDTTNTRTINASLLNSAGATVTLAASGSLSFANAVSMSTPGVGLNILANDITVNANIQTTSGNIRVRNFTDTGAANSLTVNSGRSINVGATGSIDVQASNITINGQLMAGGGTLGLTAANTISIASVSPSSGLVTNLYGNTITTNAEFSTFGDLKVRGSDGVSATTNLTINNLIDATSSVDIKANNMTIASSAGMNVGNSTIWATNLTIGSGSQIDSMPNAGTISIRDAAGAASGTINLLGGAVISVAANKSIDIAASNIFTNGTIMAGQITINAPLTLNGPTELNAAVSGLISGTIDGSQALTITGPGTMSFAGAIGGTTALASFNRASGGNLAFGSDLKATNLAINMLGSDKITLLNSQTWSFTSGSIMGAEINAATSGAQSLTLTSTTAGAVTLGAAIGATSPLATFTRSGVTGTNLKLGNSIKTTGNIAFSGNPGIDLIGPFAAQSTAGSITYLAPLNGTQNLSLNGATGITLNSLNGTPAPLGNVTLTTGGALGISGTFTANSLTINNTGPATSVAASAVINLNNAFNVTGALTVGANAQITGNAIDVNGPITIAGATLTVTGGGIMALGATSTGSVSFTGASILQGTGAASLNVRGPMSMAAASSLTTTLDGNAQFGPITMANNTPILTISGTGSAAISGLNAGTIDMSGSNRTLTLDGVVTGTFSSAFNNQNIQVGGTGLTFSPTGSNVFKNFNGSQALTINPVGGISITTLAMNAATTINASSGITFGTLSGNGAITAAASSGDITFANGSSTIGALTATALSGNVVTAGGATFNLQGSGNLNATGTVSLGASFGSTGSLSFAGAAITVFSNVTAASTATFTGPVRLTNTGVNITSGTGVNFTSTINGTTNYTENFTVSGAGTVTLGGAVGGTTPLAAFIRSGGPSLINGGSIKAGQVLLGTGATVLGANTLVEFNAANMAINGPINASAPLSAGLTLDGGGLKSVIINNTIGGTSTLSYLTLANLSGTGTFNGATVRIGGNIDLGSTPFILSGGNSTFSATNGVITAGGNIDGPTGLNLLQTGTGSLNITGAIGATTALGTVNITDGSAASSITLPSIQANTINVNSPTATIQFGGAITLAGTLGLFGQALINQNITADGINSTNSVTINGATIMTGATGLSLTGDTTLNAVNLTSTNGPQIFAAASKVTTITGATSVTGTAPINFAGTTNISGGADTLSVSATGTSITIGSITGAGGVTLTGSPTATNLGAVSSTGALDFGMTGNTITVGGDINAGSISGLQAASTNTVDIGAGSRTISTTGANPLDIANITGTAPNIWLQSSNDLVIGSVTGISNITGTVGNANTLTVVGVIGTSGAMNFNGGTIAVTGTLNPTGALSFKADTSLTVDNPITGGGTVTIDRLSSGDIFFGGSGAGLVIPKNVATQLGTRPINLGGANTQTLQLNDTINFGGAVNITATTAVNFDNTATAAYVGFSAGTNSINAPNIGILSGATIGTGPNFNLTFNGAINDLGVLNAGAGAVVINGGGTIGPMTAGSLTVNSGASALTATIGTYAVPTVTLSSTNQPITINNGLFTGTLNANSGTALLTLNTAAITGASTLNGGSIVLHDGSFTGVVTSGGPYIMGGVVTFGSDTLFSNTTLDANLTLNTPGAVTLNNFNQGGFNLNLPIRSVTIGGVSTLSGNVTTANAVTLNGTLALPGNFSVNSGNSAISANGVFSGTGGLSLTAGTGVVNMTGNIGASGSPIGALMVSGDTASLTGAAYASTINLYANNVASGTLTAGTLNSVGAVNLTAPTLTIANVVGTTLDIYAPGTISPNGAITSGTIGGFAGNNFVTVHQGTPVSTSILLNGADATIAVTTPTVAPTPTTPSVASIPTTVSMNSMPTTVSVPSMPSTVSVFTQPSSPSMGSAPSMASTATPSIIIQLGTVNNRQKAIDLITGTEKILDLILKVNPNFARSLDAFPKAIQFQVVVNAPGVKNDGVIISTDIRNIVNSAAPGQIIPATNSFVPGTTTPVAARRTVKIAVEDAGGPGGQVVVNIVRDTDGLRDIIKGLVKIQDGEKKSDFKEPPLSQQPSEIDIMSLMD